MASKFDPSLIPSSPDLSFEQNLWQAGVDFIAGVDEAGRGAWAGPVTAAAVLLPPFTPSTNIFSDVRDSKQLSAQKRYALEPLIRSNALAWGIGFATNEEIDQVGILPATRLAMRRALECLRPAPQHLLLDALFLPEMNTPQTALIKGDQRSLSIAAASILAKTARDRFMVELGESHTSYSFKRNKGYGTRVHQAALANFGPSPAHRFSFAPVTHLLKKKTGAD